MDFAVVKKIHGSVVVVSSFLTSKKSSQVSNFNPVVKFKEIKENKLLIE